MLRNAVLIIAILMTKIGFICVLIGYSQLLPTAIWGALLLIAVLFERWRYEQSGGANVGNWDKTEERFIDPETGKLKQVLYQESTGERRYVDSDEKSTHST